MQFHSTAVAEPVAHLAGFLGGLATFQIFHMAGATQSVEVASAVAASALINLVLGAKINLLFLDVLGMLIVRPASAAVGAGLIDLVLKAATHS